MKDMEKKRGGSSLGSCVCQLLLSTSEKLLSAKGDHLSWEPRYLGQGPLDGPFGKMNWTNENITTVKPGPKPEGVISLGTVVTVVSSSIGIVALILLLAGLLSMTLKKWRQERLFKKQLKHQTNFLHKSSEFSCHADAIYSNVINLASWKEDDFAVYANVPRFDRPRRTSPDQVEYASIVFH
ncbi:hypothetical protein Cadr_000023425 [Camelus dromedarius]|uniref:Uncharacterized protein n=1 Tax=Camelus dromedarius TaxID=9838 RepID=A0A5N4CJ90_CAMDR|nr:hypothetical protein Cadr_000023425 [Camelus dromedarius]